MEEEEYKILRVSYKEENSMTGEAFVDFNLPKGIKSITGLEIMDH